MSQTVIISSVTANTPVDIYYCDAMSASCVYVSTVSTFPYEFSVPDPYDTTDFVIKIQDTQGCIDGEIIYITPTPTPSVTPTLTQTPTQTASPTLTASPTPSQTATNTSTPTNTPTFTSTPTATPNAVAHAVGQYTFDSTGNTCGDVITLNNFYTYISEANTIPVVGITVYQTLVNGTLYNPYNGGNKYRKMVFGANSYAVLVDSSGLIQGFSICP